MRTLTLLLGLAIVGCVSTQMTPLGGFNPQRAPTCWQAVRVFMTAQAADTPYVEVAYLHTSATDPVGDDKLIQSMREKAAEVGANGLLFKGITETAGGVGLVSGAFTKKPSGEAVALWIPRDSAATARACADTTTAH